MTGLLGAAFIWLVFVGGTQLGAFVPAIRAVNILIGAMVIGYWLWNAPRRADLVDALILGALLSFLVACVASDIPRMSFDAAVTAVAYAAGGSIARWELAHAPTRRTLTRILAACSVVFGLLFLSLWVPVWATWFSISGDMPRVDLRLPVGPFRHHHAVAMLMAFLLPALVVYRRGLAVPFGLAAGVASIILIIGSGSRTVWTSLILAAVVVALALRRGWTWKAWGLIGAMGTLGVAGLATTGALGVLWQRLTTESSAALRLEIWRASLERWTTDIVFGVGPGTFSSSFTLSSYFDRYAAVGRHPDNGFVQLLTEAGLFGILALAFVVAALVIGRRAAGPASSGTATIGVVLFALSSLTNDPASAGYYLIPVGIAWAALMTPAVGRPLATDWPSARSRRAVLGLAVIPTSAVLVMFIAAVAFDAARPAIREGDQTAAMADLNRSVALDPANALHVRQRGIEAIATGDMAGALDDLLRAVDLNEGDTVAWRGLAIVASQEGDHDLAVRAAERAASLRPTHAENLAVLAYVYQEANRSTARDSALVELLRRFPWIAAAPAWAEWFPSGDALGDLLRAADDAWEQRVEPSQRFAFEQVWLNAVSGDDPGDLPSGAEWSIDLPYLHALDALMRCDLASASGSITAIPTSASAQELSVVILVGAATGQRDVVSNAIRLQQLRGYRDGDLALAEPDPSSPLWDFGENYRLYGALPSVNVERAPMLPTEADGLSAWLRDPLSAARVGAPGSGLAACAAGND